MVYSSLYRYNRTNVLRTIFSGGTFIYKLTAWEHPYQQNARGDPASQSAVSRRAHRWVCGTVWCGQCIEEQSAHSPVLSCNLYCECRWHLLVRLLYIVCTWFIRYACTKIANSQSRAPNRKPIDGSTTGRAPTKVSSAVVLTELNTHDRSVDQLRDETFALAPFCQAYRKFLSVFLGCLLTHQQYYHTEK